MANYLASLEALSRWIDRARALNGVEIKGKILEWGVPLDQGEEGHNQNRDSPENSLSHRVGTDEQPTAPALGHLPGKHAFAGMTLPAMEASGRTAIQAVKLEQAKDPAQAPDQYQDRRDMLGQERESSRSEPRDQCGECEKRIGNEPLRIREVGIKKNRRTCRRTVEIGIMLTKPRGRFHRRKNLNGN